MRNRNTLEFISIWEELHNPGFNSNEFVTFKSQASLNSFNLTPRMRSQTFRCCRLACDCHNPPCCTSHVNAPPQILDVPDPGSPAGMGLNSCLSGQSSLICLLMFVSSCAEKQPSTILEDNSVKRLPSARIPLRHEEPLVQFAWRWFCTEVEENICLQNDPTPLHSL
jgi:hypothetical protein